LIDTPITHSSPGETATVELLLIELSFTLTQHQLRVAVPIEVVVEVVELEVELVDEVEEVVELVDEVVDEVEELVELVDEVELEVEVEDEVVGRRVVVVVTLRVVEVVGFMVVVVLGAILRVEVVVRFRDVMMVEVLVGDFPDLTEVVVLELVVVLFVLCEETLLCNDEEVSVGDFELQLK
jgi:hypothetical protein